MKVNVKPFRHWTLAEDRVLDRMFADGYNAIEIADFMDRTPASIRCRLLKVVGTSKQKPTSEPPVYPTAQVEMSLEPFVSTNPGEQPGFISRLLMRLAGFRCRL